LKDIGGWWQGRWKMLSQDSHRSKSPAWNENGFSG
jgi:hypothetical protein